MRLALFDRNASGKNSVNRPYITKPISPSILLARVATHLALTATADYLRDKSASLEREVAKRPQEVQAIQDVTIMAMTSLAETRNNETGNHIRRTQLYVKALAERLRHHPRFEAALNARMIALLYKSAPLHDIGKIVNYVLDPKGFLKVVQYS